MLPAPAQSKFSIDEVMCLFHPFLDPIPPPFPFLLMSDPSSSPSASSLSPQSPIKRTSNGHGSSSPAIFQEERLEGTILLPASLARNRPALSGLKSEGLQLVTHSYDVGLDGMFQSIPQEDIPLIERSCRSIAKAYTKESQNKEWFIKWNNRLCEKPEEVAWSFHIDHHTAHRGVYSPNSPNKIVVLSVPIAHQTRIKSRGTRCYLAFDYALVDGNPFYKMLNKEIMKHVHTLKTSWVSPLRSPEFEFYQKAIARQADAKAKGIKFEDFHLATMLSGGYIEGSLQDYSREHKSGMGSQKELPSQNARQINWLLMKEVGRPIGTFQNGREFLEVIRDTAKTLQALYDLRILHRDVSANNVLIDIVTGCGLLIDLDLAKDLDENQHSGRPAVTVSSFEMLYTKCGPDLFRRVLVASSHSPLMTPNFHCTRYGTTWNPCIGQLYTSVFDTGANCQPGSRKFATYRRITTEPSVLGIYSPIGERNSCLLVNLTAATILL
ncbi:hypothetical protein FRC14_008094 [Serendipita sp. 396]|nr:hypothetical protein FRC14_008094 [Serendipita sp. 396]